PPPGLSPHEGVVADARPARLGVTDRAARVLHEDVVQRGPGNTDRLDADAERGEQVGDEPLTVLDVDGETVLAGGRGPPGLRNERLGSEATLEARAGRLGAVG